MAELVLHTLAATPMPRRRPTEAELPHEDGEPLAEGDFQLKPTLYALYALQTHFADRADATVHVSKLVHYEAVDERGKGWIQTLPVDVLVSFGVPKRLRHSYVVWEEGKPPDFVLEIMAPGTWRRDLGSKQAECARLGVREYWAFDPEGAHLDPPLAGFALVGGEYRPILPQEAGRAAFASDVLGLVLRIRDDGTLRFKDPATGEDFLTHLEMYAATRPLTWSPEDSATRRDRLRGRPEIPLRGISRLTHRL